MFDLNTQINKRLHENITTVACITSVLSKASFRLDQDYLSAQEAGRSGACEKEVTQSKNLKMCKKDECLHLVPIHDALLDELQYTLNTFWTKTFMTCTLLL